MKIKVTLDDQPEEFLRALPPATKRQVRDALHAIERGEASPVALEDDLDGFYKIRVGGLRLIAKHFPDAAGPRYRVIFAERRSVVYVLFKQLLGLE
jgi:mRNA-degrading endonuclease RelE of RelBE toxin-antitoxin system